MKLYEIPANVKTIVIHKTYKEQDKTTFYEEYHTKKENTFHETVYDPIAYHNNRTINYELSQDALEMISYFTWKYNYYTFTDDSGWFMLVHAEHVKTLV